MTDRNGGRSARRAPRSAPPLVEAARRRRARIAPLLDREELLRLSERRDSWSDAVLETAAALLKGTEEHPLALLASRLRSVARADDVIVVRAVGDEEALTVVATSGTTTGWATGDPMPADDLISTVVIRADQPRLEAEARAPRSGGPGRGPRMAVPLRSGSKVVGAVLVGRTVGGPPFDESDLGLLATFIAHASIAIELAEARSDRERAVLLEDRGRIARDLHDTAIQQLFAAGLELRATATALEPDDAAARVLHAVELVDVAIGQIRTVVLALSPVPGADSLRRQIIDVVRDLALPFPTLPDLVFDGPIDLIAQGSLTGDVVAVIRESLANAAKHADAGHAGVAVRAMPDRVEIEVWDDGIGLPEHPARSGLANLASRAEARGGTFQVSARSPGTRVIWSVPVSDAEAAA